MPEYPKMFRLRQKFEAPRVDDVPGTVKAELAKLELQKKVKPGQTVAITAGSRGIANIRHIIKAAVEHFQSIGAKPFIVPAMVILFFMGLYSRRVARSWSGMVAVFLAVAFEATLGWYIAALICP